MRKLSGFPFLALTLLALLPMNGEAQTAGPNVPVTTTVTVLGKKFTPAPPIGMQDVSVYEGKMRLNVTKWVPAQGPNAPLQLAIVIDNSASEFGVGSQLRDIAGFISLQSKDTAVGVFYAMNGTVEVASPFSTDHQAVSKALRVPLGLRAGESPSIYISLSDLVKHRWTASGARREVLLISTGVDRLDRGPESPYVQAAIEDVEKSGIVVHTIYTGGNLHFAESLHGQYAQSNLEELTAGSGGYGFFEGLTAPVSFGPFLQQLNQVLHSQYLLTFSAPVSNHKNGELHGIDVRLEQRDLEIKYPKQVLIPGASGNITAPSQRSVSH